MSQSQSESSGHRERDSSSLIVLGGFFLLMGTFVLLGTFWEDIGSFPSFVNIGAGSIIVLVGLSMFVVGRRWRRSSVGPEAASPVDKSP